MHLHAKYHKPLFKDKKSSRVDRNIPRNNGYLTLRSKVKVIDRQYWYMTHRLIVMHLFAKYHKPLLKDKESSRVDRNIPLNNGYLTLRSKVKVIERQYWYVTHRLMVMHLHTKYHLPKSKNKKVLGRTGIYPSKRDI